MITSLAEPIFFIGMPRSGTTIIFEAFARHPDLAWLTNYAQRYPEKLWLNMIRRLHDNALIKIDARKKQYADVIPGNRYFSKPAEAYPFWDLFSGLDFSFSYLAGKRSGNESRRIREAVSKVVRYQGRKRFSAKLTGPPRISYLASIFPDAKFIHVIRDGRAVTHSLLKVPFWREKGGLDGPFWDGLPARYEQIWRNDKDPGVITALQWCYILDLADLERQCIRKSQYTEVKYEDFVSDAHHWLRQLFRFCNLANNNRPHNYLDSSRKLENMNFKYACDWDKRYTQKLEHYIAPGLKRYGYCF